jgi:hemolysin III
MNIKEIKSEFKKQKNNLKTSYKNEARKSKSAYREKKLSARRDYELAVSDYYVSVGKKPPKPMPRRSVIEEIGNSVSHGLGSAFSVVALILMLVFSNNAAESTSAALYSAGMFITFTVSCLYHAFGRDSDVKRLFRRFDYCSIYILIGATFIPVLLALMGDAFGITFLVIQWAVIAAGISLVAVFGPGKLRFVHIPLYVALGWSALMLMPSMIAVSFPLAMWILGGGIVYSIGIIPFVIKVRVSHFIWHVFVLAGAVVQWVGIFVYIYLP